MPVPAALLDVDGTLIDSNYQHALAWYRALRRSGIVLPLWRIHRAVGMGGDQLVPALVGTRSMPIRVIESVATETSCTGSSSGRWPRSKERTS
jgi:beta-phosphoglucomutase-like phosphatase (HAD superfamily)